MHVCWSRTGLRLAWAERLLAVGFLDSIDGDRSDIYVRAQLCGGKGREVE